MINPQFIMEGKYNSCMEILNEFPNIVDQDEKQMLDSEFRELKFLNFKDIFDDFEINLPTFWKTVCGQKRGDKTSAFPLIDKFIQQIMILPHSSANVERIFSQVNLNKTKFRCSLVNESLEGILYSKDFLKYNNSNCFDIDIKKDILNLTNSSMYS